MHISATVQLLFPTYKHPFLNAKPLSHVLKFLYHKKKKTGKIFINKPVTIPEIYHTSTHLLAKNINGKTICN